MKVIVDDKIPYIRGVFEPFADVCYLAPEEVTREAVQTADAMVVRTRTRCGAGLLQGSQVSHIATATIGFDHIDTAFCASAGITFSTSVGCNARAVAQWVFAALRELADGGSLSGRTLGVIGVGNVGREVCQIADTMGVEVLKNDPPRALAQGGEGFVELDYLLANSDIVTMHVPLSDDTQLMANAQFFSALRPGAWFLNSSRGEVVDEAAVAAAKRGGRIAKMALDVWCNEPNVDHKLLSLCDIATPHIAGYSARGKARATQMAVHAIAKKFNIEPLINWSPECEMVLEEPNQYNIIEDDVALRGAPLNFEKLRNTYNYR